jgi:hypothetical protein
LLKDLKVLGRREIGNLLKWRGKVREVLHKLEDVKRKNSQATLKN